MFTGASTDHQFLQCPSMSMPMPTMDRKWKSNVEIAPNCPRCASSNTKFCYYNNYSLSQPRYFCKGCRRYWTKGGSLRNVPVGGGCRKNRRAKSASRLSQNERVSVNYSKSFNGFDHDNNVTEQTAKGCSSDADSVVQPSGADIDMAVVFAKFLNQSSSNSDNPDELGHQELDNVSNSLTPDSVQNDAMIECQQPSDHDHAVPEENFLEEFNQILVGEKQQEYQKEDQRVQDLLESDMNAAFELQTLLDDHDHVVQDLSWATDHAAATFPNFTWQSVLQLQDFDSFPANDHQLLTSASNLVTDNWSPSFDFSAGFEVYSRP